MIPLVNPALARQSAAQVQPWLRGAIRWIVVALALVATLDAAYLAYTSLTHGVVAGCGLVGSGCDVVMGSRWSRVLGLPVALGGLLCYGAILTLAVFAGTRRFNESVWLGTALATAAFVAALSGLWFTSLQFVEIGQLCIHCLSTHFCGAVIAILVLWATIQGKPSGALGVSRSAVMAVPGARRTSGPRPAERPVLSIAASLACLLVGLLVAGQLIFAPSTLSASKPALTESIDLTAAHAAVPPANDGLSPTATPHVVNRPTDAEPTGDSAAATAADDDNALASHDEPSDDAPAGADPAAERPKSVANDAPKLSREVKFLNGKLTIDTYQEAVLGSPDAKYVVLEMMDYTCPHCRKMHAHIQEAMHRYGDQLAVVILPMPLELDCNKLVPATDPLHRGACKISRTALAVAKVDPEKFIDFHNFLLANEKRPPTAAQALFRAFKLVDRSQLRGQSGSQDIEDRLQRNIKLFHALSSQNHGGNTFGLPVQIINDTVLTGGDLSSEELFEAWEKACDIKPL